MNAETGSLAHDPSTNNPPEPTVRERIEQLYARELARIAELIASCEAAPASIGNDETAGKVGDLKKMVRTALKAADEARKIEKEPHMTRAKEVDAIFINLMDKLEAAWKKPNEALGDYLEKKKEAERLERERKAKEERDKAERLAREAAELAERRRIADEAAAEAEAARREASENKDSAEQRKLNAVAAVAKAKADRASARRDKDEGKIEAAEAALTAANAELDSAKEELRQHREAAAAALKAAERAASEAKAATKDHKQTESDAGRADTKASRAEKETRATPAEMSRTRSGDLGSVSSLAQRWTFDIVDLMAIPANKLWPYFSEEDIRGAVSRAVHQGVRELPGVNIFQTSEARTV